MSSLFLVPVGDVPDRMMHEVLDFLVLRLGVEGRMADVVVDPFPAFEPGRSQYNSRELLKILATHSERLEAPVLGMTDVDLYSVIFTFVIGEAQLAGSAGIFSLHRLRPSVYGLPKDEVLLMERAKKEALHESGHLVGLVHCRHPFCVMRFCAIVEEVDLKSDELCPACLARLAELSC